VHDHVLRLLHPFMPFVTEELWQTLPQRDGEGLTPDGQARTITRAAYPSVEPGWQDDAAVAVLELVQEVTTTVRTVRAELGVPPSRKLTLVIEGATAANRAELETHAEYVRRLARLESFSFAETVEQDPNTVRRVVGDMRLHLPLAGIVDQSAETSRIERELGKLAKQLASLNGKLGNPKFRERAAPAVVAEAEAQLETAQGRQAQLQEILAELQG
jgi:valyl-tRNA synthetase